MCAPTQSRRPAAATSEKLLQLMLPLLLPLRRRAISG
jgi:hypothetical protein